MNDSLIERMNEIAHRDSAVSVTVRADDLRALLSKVRAPVADERAAVDHLARVLQAAWAKAEPGHSVTLNPTSYVATFADMARAALASAPVAGEASVVWKYTHVTGRVELSLTPFSGPGFVEKNWVATPYYATPQASEADKSTSD